MKQPHAIEILVPILFFAPAFATYLGGPYVGVGISGVYLFFHYAHGSFRRYKDDPMEIVQLSPSKPHVTWDPTL